MRLVYDYSKRYCYICEIVIDRTDMVIHKSNKKQLDNLPELENLPEFIF